MKLFKFTVVTIDEGSIQKTKTTVYSNINDYSFPINGDYFFMSEKPKMSKELPGKANVVSHWIPKSKIVSISADSDIPFDTLKARKTFVDGLK